MPAEHAGEEQFRAGMKAAEYATGEVVDKQPATPAPPAKRMTMGQVVEALLNRGGGEHSSVTLTRNSKGETQVEVVVRTGDTGPVQTVTDAEAVATEVYDRLRSRYPMGGTNGGES